MFQSFLYKMNTKLYIHLLVFHEAIERIVKSDIHKTHKNDLNNDVKATKKLFG